MACDFFKDIDNFEVKLDVIKCKLIIESYSRLLSEVDGRRDDNLPLAVVAAMQKLRLLSGRLSKIRSLHIRHGGSFVSNINLAPFSAFTELHLDRLSPLLVANFADFCGRLTKLSITDYNLTNGDLKWTGLVEISSARVENKRTVGNQGSTCLVPSSLWNLTELTLNSCNLESFGADLSNLPALTVLNLSYNRLSQLLFTQDYPSLTDIDVSHNQLKTMVVAPSVKLDGLVSLNVSHNKIRELSWIKYLSASMQCIDASYNEITDITEVSHMSGLRYLSSIRFLGNPIDNARKSGGTFSHFASSVLKTRKETQHKKDHKVEWGEDYRCGVYAQLLADGSIMSESGHKTLPLLDDTPISLSERRQLRYIQYTTGLIQFFLPPVLEPRLFPFSRAKKLLLCHFFIYII
jgi:Leucine-rich repeat (LRR) protein